MNIRPETIAAAATPPGPSALGIVRLSGPDSISIADSIFTLSGKKKPSHLKPRSSQVGYITDGRGVVDQAVISVMKAPSSYTGEDMVEFTCHGSMLIISRLLQLCRRRGARYADPGEFTRRAFLNGKMDLTQAEAVNSLIRARTEETRLQAVSLVRGRMKKIIQNIRKEIEEMKVLIDADIEWGEEQKIDFLEGACTEKRLEGVISSLDELLKNSSPAESSVEGYRVVICGRPNAGKSSLFNSLLNLSRSITSRIPGTTRDVIESETVTDGYLIRFVDTAGVGLENPSEIDKISEYRSLEAIGSADLVLYVVDCAGGITEKDRCIILRIGGRKWIPVLNKTDLEKNYAGERNAELFGKSNPVYVSCKNKKGIRKLGKRIIEELGGHASHKIMVSLRQKNLLEDFSSSVRDALCRIREVRYELASSDLSRSLNILGKIDGKTLEDNMLDRIFESFCIGK